MRSFSAVRPGDFFLALGLIQVVCFAQPQLASADLMVINNGLAPPNPDNVLDDGTFKNDGVFVRNMGCGDSLAYSSCPSPGDPTDSEIVDGGRADTFYALDTSTITMRGGQVTRQMQAMDGGHITVMGGTIGGYLGALENSTVSLYSGNVDGFLHADHLSVLSWYGGSVGGRLQAGGDRRAATAC